MQNQNIRIAIQKKGRLQKDSQELLEQCGIKVNFNRDCLIAHAENMPIDLLLVRNNDIPGLLMDGVVDLGIVGQNLIEEIRLEREVIGLTNHFQSLIQLDFGACRLSLASDKDKPYNSIQDLNGKRIATSYPNILKSYLDLQKIDFNLCTLTGSVEVAPRAGLADAICDLISTGATLEANGLREREVIFYSKALLVQREGSFSKEQQGLIQQLSTRIQSVLKARESKYIMLHAPTKTLEKIIELLPGAETPTILPLAQSKTRVAVHMVSQETLFWETMENLKSLGASSILVLPIEKIMA